jgi:cytochrome c oxidase subunit 3
VSHSPILFDSTSHGPEKVEHQFDDAAQQADASSLGMWTFLATEVLFFGALFVAYSVNRYLHPNDFKIASSHLHLWHGTANTAILLCSSQSMALAVAAAQAGRQTMLRAMLGITMLLGLCFLGVKAWEYSLEFEEHLYPAGQFEFPEAPESGPGVRLFMTFYFLMTGLHALHMIGGEIVLGIVLMRALKHAYSSAYHNTVEVAGLYWHFVDVVWVFLFPTLYLLRT